MSQTLRPTWSRALGLSMRVPPWRARSTLRPGLPRVMPTCEAAAHDEELGAAEGSGCHAGTALDTLASPNCEAGFRGAGLLGSEHKTHALRYRGRVITRCGSSSTARQ